MPTSLAKLIWGDGGQESFLVSVRTSSNHFFGSHPGSYRVGICATFAVAAHQGRGFSVVEGR